MIVLIGLIGPLVVVVYTVYKFFMTSTQIIPIDQTGYVLCVEKWGEVTLPTKLVMDFVTMAELNRKLSSKLNVSAHNIRANFCSLNAHLRSFI